MAEAILEALNRVLALGGVGTMIIFVWLGGIGLLLSLFVHFITFVGVNILEKLPEVWLLHIGLFVVWIPTLIVCIKTCSKERRKDHLKIATKNAPKWLKHLCIVFFVYMFFNFFFTIFVLNEGGMPYVKDGQNVLANHGKVIRVLTDVEYVRHRAYNVRAFSGHWMFLYCFAFAALLSRRREPRSKGSIN